MIKTFKISALKKLFERGDRSKINPDHIERVEDILFSLDISQIPADMDVPGWDLHKLKGDLKGFWSVTVSGNFRVWFKFKDTDVVDVGYGDYH